MAIETILAGIGAGASLVSGIFGSSSASKANKEAKKAQKKQQEALDKAADYTNEYNKRAFEVQKENYFRNRKWARDTELRNWRYNQQIQDYEYKAVVERYSQSVKNTENQLAFNSMAAIDAYAAEQASLNELMTEDAFNRQGMLVDRLQQEGTAALGQAGNSRNKAIQSRLAAAGRDSSIMDASLASSVEQSNRNMQQISMQRYGADLAAKAQMMIKPEALPDIPMPTQAPAQIFIEPAKVFPGMAAPAQQQNIYAPLFSGVSGAASALGRVDWKGLFGGG